MNTMTTWCIHYMSAEENKLDNLEEEAAELRETRNELFARIGKYRDQRDSLNESSSKIREEALKHKEERDRLNASIQEIKKSLGPLFDDLDETRQKLSKTDQALRTEYRSRPNKTQVQKDLQETEWEIMTTPTREILDREEQLITRAAKLRKTLEGFKSLEKQQVKKMDIMAEKKATENDITSIREEIQKLAERSQEHHEKMIMFFEKADEEKKRADETHRRYVETIQEVEKVKDEINMIMPQINALRNGIKVKDMKAQERRRMSVQERKEQMRQEALKKMESGEKLTFEDMKLIYGEE